MAPLVCCLDDSDGARHALPVAQRLAAQLGLELVLLHVEPRTEVPGVSAATAGQERLHEEELRDAEALLARYARDARLTDARFRTAIGRPGETIVAICAEEEAEFVVLGSRGRGGLKSALLGSVSSEVAAKTPCPCVIVPPAATHG
jgi:nucleotide-binding universal stress UspA family protein